MLGERVMDLPLKDILHITIFSMLNGGVIPENI